MGCNCGKQRRAADKAAAERYVDPTRAVFAAARVRYMVLPHSGTRHGQRFNTLIEAEAYAKRYGGVIRAI